MIFVNNDKLLGQLIQGDSLMKESGSEHLWKHIDLDLSNYRNQSVGLLNFFGALKCATEDFLDELSQNTGLQSTARARYESLRKSTGSASLANRPGQKGSC